MPSSQDQAKTSLFDLLGQRYPYILLLIASLCFSVNIVLGRGLHELVPPFALTFWRWLLVALILLPFCAGNLWRKRQIIIQHRWLLLGLGAGSVTCYNGLFYVGLHLSSAVNGALVASTMPLVIAFLAWLVYRQVPGVAQRRGIWLSLIGIVIIFAKGDLALLTQFQFSGGDLWILAATFSWSAYSVALRKVPAELGGLTLVNLTAITGVITLLPLFIWELGTDATIIINTSSVSGIVVLALFPGILAYLTYAKAVATVGPVHAGVFLNTSPLFAITAAVLFLGEQIYQYHLVGGAVIALGLVLVSKPAASTR
ncbi:MAG: DMT family transporter [Immundisolibacteraceae bacterium]|nr:DMT family transporter [Immundisolibacteraceae bacterium]